MKKFVCLLLALAMVLSLFGCGAGKPPETPSETGAQAQPQNDASDMETASTPEETAEASTGGGLAFSLPELPEIGEYYSGEKIEYFFADGARDVFTPRDDYGRLSLYYADVTYYRDITTRDPEWSEAGYRCDYGLMTADGKVITGANWTEGYEMPFSETAGCFVLQTATPGDEDDAKYTSDLIGLNGSWAMHRDGYVSVTNLFDCGLPYFVIDSDPECAVYDVKTGAKVLSLKDFAKTDENGDFTYLPDIIYADGDLLLLATDSLWQQDVVRQTFTAVDWDGNVRYTKTLTDRSLFHSGGRLITQSSFNGVRAYRLLDHDLEPIGDKDYTDVLYDDATGYTLGFYGSGDDAGADYFDADGNAVYPETGWTARQLNAMDDTFFWRSAAGSVFYNTNRIFFADFFGQEIPLPAPAAYADIVEDYENDVLYIYERGEDGVGYFCTADGTLLFRLDAPYEFQYSSDGDRYVSLTANRGYLTAVYEDGGFLVFDLTEKKETYSGVLEDVYPAGTGVDDVRAYNLWFMPGGLMCVWSNRVTDVFDVATMQKKYRGATSAVVRGPLTLIATPTECLALDKDGNVLYRAGNGKLA